MIHTNKLKNWFLAALDIPVFKLACIAELTEVRLFRRRFAGSNSGRQLGQNSNFSGSLCIKKSIFFLFIFFFVFSAKQQAEEDNTFIVTDNGLEMFHWDLDFVSQAEQSIEIAAVFLGGDIAQTLFTALEKRLLQVPALQIYLLTNPILLEQKDWERLDALQLQYPERFHLQFSTTVAVLIPDLTGIDNHIKMFVVDEKYFSTGGTNLDETQCSEGTWTPPKKCKKIHETTNTYLPSGMRDQDVVGKGPMAQDLRKTFYKLYATWEHYNKSGSLQKDPEYFKNNNHYFPITKQAEVERFDRAVERHRLVGSHQVKKILGGPHQSPSEITAAYVRLINEAEEEIIIANLYFCPVDSIFQALLKAVNRGVKLTVLTNGVSEIAPNYTSMFCWANRITYVPIFYGKTYHFWDAPLLEKEPIKNTRIFEYHLKDILLHKKTMIVDRKKSIVGSYNLGTRSASGEYEMVLEFDSEEIANDLFQVHQKDLQFSREVTPLEARNWYFDPVTAYLAEIQKRFHGLI